MPYRKLWIALTLVLVISFAVLGGVGVKVLENAPPIPLQVVTTDGHVLFDGTTIQDGQGAWQSIGGQEVGTVWGHGSYIAPDWTADWLHRECTFILDRWAADSGAANYAALGVEQQEHVTELIRAVRSHGVAVLVISHNLPQVSSLCDRILVLYHGQLVTSLDAAGTSLEEIVLWLTSGSRARRPHNV